jgi:hypothetical protein
MRGRLNALFLVTRDNERGNVSGIDTKQVLRQMWAGYERWPGKTAHRDKWIICLTAPTGAG